MAGDKKCSAAIANADRAVRINLDVDSSDLFVSRNRSAICSKLVERSISANMANRDGSDGIKRVASYSKTIGESLNAIAQYLNAIFEQILLASSPTGQDRLFYE